MPHPNRPPTPAAAYLLVIALVVLFGLLCTYLPGGTQ